MVSLTPGENSVRVITSNQWHQKSSEPSVIRYFPAPEIAEKDAAIKNEELIVRIKGSTINPIVGFRHGGVEIERDSITEEISGETFSITVGSLPVTAEKLGGSDQIWPSSDHRSSGSRDSRKSIAARNPHRTRKRTEDRPPEKVQCRCRRAVKT